MQIRYLDEILECITDITSFTVVLRQHSFVEACHYYVEAISNAFNKILDEFKDDPQTAAKTYSDIDLKLLLDQLDQLRRDFKFESAALRKLMEENKHKGKPPLSGMRDSFDDFMRQAGRTMREIEDLIQSIGFELKVVYSTETYYQFDELLEQLQNDMLEEDNQCFSDDMNEKMKPKYNQIAKKFWNDNFGENDSVDYCVFFEKFKNYVSETEKANIDDTFYDVLGRYLEKTFTLKVFLWNWNDFFSNFWSKYNFRKEFLLPHHPKPHPNIKCFLSLTLEYDQIEKEKKVEKKVKIDITQDDFKRGEEELRTKNIMKTPLVFGRETKAYKPDVCIPIEYISNKHFQIAAYCRGLLTDGFYITDLYSKAKTGLQIDQECYIDEGNVLQFSNNFQVRVAQVRPRYEEDDPDLEKGLFVRTRVEKEHVTKQEKPSLKLSEVDPNKMEEKEYNEEVYLYLSTGKDDKTVGVFKERPELDKTIECDAKFYFDKKRNKWMCESTYGQILLVNWEECEGRRLSAGFRLKEGYEISCGSVTLTVNSCSVSQEGEKNEEDKKKKLILKP